MRRIIVIVVLSVLTVVLSGCDKIKMELERRHLGAESSKQTAKVDNSFDEKRNDSEAPSARKQIVIRIDLPMEEKLQIRMIKLPVSEEKSNDVVNSPNETLKEDAPRADIPQNKPENSVEPDKKSLIKLETPKSEEPKTEIKTDVEQEPKSEMKTDREEPLPDVVPAPAPAIIVPQREVTTSPPLPLNLHERSAMSRFIKANPAPAEAAVGSALAVTPPETIAPSFNESLKAPIEIKAPIETNKASTSSPWAIPNAEYPLRYY